MGSGCPMLQNYSKKQIYHYVVLYVTYPHQVPGWNIEDSQHISQAVKYEIWAASQSLDAKIFSK